MCFVVTVKENTRNFHHKNDPGESMHMCLQKDQNIQRGKVPWKNKDGLSNNEIAVNNLEISDWKRKKCEECNRIYYTVIVLTLLSKDASLIRNLGKILEKIQRRSITTGKEVHQILHGKHLEILFNLGILQLKMMLGEFSSWNNVKHQSKILHHKKVTNFLKIGRAFGYKCKFLKFFFPHNSCFCILCIVFYQNGSHLEIPMILRLIFQFSELK